ncbi:hypothetical protein B3286c1_1765 [Brucella vulpis]|uniref:hypothetical protein n=1 Tax=Brucella vulpis TaxID=981386 RepID=UPI00073A63E3|nr:hypothetical protein BF3285c1_1766 [Brucella vulpis]CUW50566.1 hypothetical protein B3286c1_1765 [Brucella vulpis]
MSLTRKEADMIDRYISATLAARAFLEPHPSWDHERLRKEALTAIAKACGPTAGMDHHYPSGGDRHGE